jgi:hypothetical protein
MRRAFASSTSIQVYTLPLSRRVGVNWYAVCHGEHKTEVRWAHHRKGLKKHIIKRKKTKKLTCLLLLLLFSFLQLNPCLRNHLQK